MPDGVSLWGRILPHHRKTKSSLSSNLMFAIKLLHAKIPVWNYRGSFLLQEMHILRSTIFLGFLNCYLKNTGSLEVVWFLKVALAACLLQYCNNSKKNFNELKKNLSQMYGIARSLVKRADLNIGYRLIELEAGSCTASLCYWKICKGIICDTWVMVLLYKLCWGRKYL